MADDDFELESTPTKFTDDYKENSIICYICGCDCEPLGSRLHEANCLSTWLKEHPNDIDFSPREPTSYPDPFHASKHSILNYNRKALHCFNFLYSYISDQAAADEGSSKVLSHPAFRKENVIPKKFVPDGEQTESSKKLSKSKSSQKKTFEGCPKILKHDEVVSIMQSKAIYLNKIPAPGRIPKGHEYAYVLDQTGSTNKLILQPCFLATEELKKMGLPSHAGSASSKNVIITPNVATL